MCIEFFASFRFPFRSGTNQQKCLVLFSFSFPFRLLPIPQPPQPPNPPNRYNHPSPHRTHQLHQPLRRIVLDRAAAARRNITREILLMP